MITSNRGYCGELAEELRRVRVVNEVFRAGGDYNTQSHKSQDWCTLMSLRRIHEQALFGRYAVLRYHYTMTPSRPLHHTT